MKRKLSIKFICRVASLRLLLVFGLLAFGFSMTAQQNPWMEEFESLTDLWKSGKLEDEKSKFKGEKPIKGTPSFDNEKALTVFTSEAAFLSSTGCTNTQVFSGSSCILDGIDSPLNEGNTGFCFTPGEILPGIEFNATANNGPGAGGLVAVDPVAGFGNPADVVLANFFIDGFVIDFDPAVNAVGLEVHTLLGGFNVTVDVYDENGGFLGSSSVGAGSFGGFIGFSSPDPIGSVVITDPFGGAEGVSAVSYCLGASCYEGPNCAEYTGGPGFEWDSDCEEAVCDADPFCCEIAWDSVCAGEAAADFTEECATCLGLDDGCGCVDPDIVIEVEVLPAFCQGYAALSVKILNPDELDDPLTFEWSNGLGFSQSAVITENGTYEVTVTAGDCESSDEVTVNIDPMGVLSAYTIVSGGDLEMHNSEVVSGGVGILEFGESTVQDNTNINTWLVGSGVVIDGSSSVANYVNADLGLSLPPFLVNENSNNGMEMINGTVTLTGDDYGHVYVKDGATLNIGNGEMNMRSLTLGKSATLNFNQETNLLIKQDLVMGALCEVNIEGPLAVMYVGGTVQIGQGSTVAANIYSIEEIDVNDSGSFMTTYMYGLFISTDGVFSGDNVVWGWNPVCTEGGEGGEECVPDDNDGDCFSANGTPGCEYNDCEAAVCAIDPFCCDTSWDSICASEAADLCTPCDNGGGNGGPDDNDGNCCAPGGNGTPGCEYNDCEAAVCAIDPFCCDTSWDGICAGEAADICDVCNDGFQAQVGSEEDTIEDGNTEKVDNLVLFPNPSAGQITIAVDDFMGESVAMTVTNAMGQRVWTQRIDVLETSRIAIDLTDARYPSGVYYMTMYVNDAVLTKQFVLSK